MADHCSRALIIPTQLGRLRVEITARGRVAALQLSPAKGTTATTAATAADQPVLRFLQDYAAGKTSAGKLPLDLSAGTDFQRRVWRALQRIPRGQTRSYAWVAREIGQPRAVRAVGAACGANPIPILIPCHRVVRSDGGLGGFSSGLAWKRKLLHLEASR